MKSIKIKVENNIAVVTEKPKRITSGTVGLPVEFTFDSHWDGLSKVAVFMAGKMQMMQDGVVDTATVPWEILKHPGVRLNIGVYGVNADGSVAIATVWATVGTIHHGADPDHVPSAAPTLPIWKKLQDQIVSLQNSVRELQSWGVYFRDAIDLLKPAVSKLEGSVGKLLTAVGNLFHLKTKSKDNLVDAINEVYDGLQDVAVGVDEEYTLPVANDIMLDAYLTRMVEKTEVGSQRYVKLNVPGAGCTLEKGAWLIRIWRESEELAVLEATNENGHRVTRTLRGHAKAILNEETVDNWKVEAEQPGVVDPPGRPVAVMANGFMRIRADGRFTYASVHVDGCKYWSNYTVEADMTYVDDTDYAGLVYNGSAADLHQKVGIFRSGTSAPKYFINGRQGGAVANMWLNNRDGYNLAAATNCSGLRVGQKFRLKAETWNMDGSTPGCTRLSTAFYDANGNLGAWTVQKEVDNIDPKTWRGTVGFLASYAMTLDVDNIKVTDANGTVLYNEDFSAYDGVWGEWVDNTTEIDASLTIEGAAADAAVVGKRLDTLQVLNDVVQKAEFRVYCGSYGGAYINHGLEPTTILRSECLLEDGGGGTPIAGVDRYWFSVDDTWITVGHSYDPSEGQRVPYEYANVTIWYL